MPQILNVHHITHNVSRPHVEAARRFYSGLLGLKEIPSTEDPAGQRLIWFEVGGSQLHLVICDTPDTPSTRHCALAVSDLESIVERLAASGVRIEPKETGWIAQRRDGSRSAFCYDPDGNRIELVAP